MTRLNAETIGKLFVDEHGNYWRHISYCEHPTATVERVEWRDGNPERRGGAVGSPILQDLGLRLLAPQDDSQTASQSEGV